VLVLQKADRGRSRLGRRDASILDMSAVIIFHSDECSSAEAARRLVKQHDFVITSGGIGPTHDGMRAYFLMPSVVCVDLMKI
jgi:hypothetical protein